MSNVLSFIVEVVAEKKVIFLVLKVFLVKVVEEKSMEVLKVL